MSAVDLKKAREKARRLRQSAPAEAPAAKKEPAGKDAKPAKKKKKQPAAKPAAQTVKPQVEPTRPAAEPEAQAMPPDPDATSELVDLLDSGNEPEPARPGSEKDEDWIDWEEEIRNLEEEHAAERQTIPPPPEPAPEPEPEPVPEVEAAPEPEPKPEPQQAKSTPQPARTGSSADSDGSSQDDGFLDMIQEELYRRTFMDKDRYVEPGEKFIAFRLADELYAVHITEVKEIIKLKKELTEVPRTDGFVAGILSLRGIIVPVLDLRKRLGLTAAGFHRSSRILVIPDGEGLVGLIVDAVIGVVKIPESRMEPPPSALGKVDLEYISGVGRLEKEFYIMLQIDRLVNFA